MPLYYYTITEAEKQQHAGKKIALSSKNERFRPKPCRHDSRSTTMKNVSAGTPDRLSDVIYWQFLSLLNYGFIAESHQYSQIARTDSFFKQLYRLFFTCNHQCQWLHFLDWHFFPEQEFFKGNFHAQEMIDSLLESFFLHWICIGSRKSYLMSIVHRAKQKFLSMNRRGKECSNAEMPVIRLPWSISRTYL